MKKLTKIEEEAFAKIGDAICTLDAASKEKKKLMPVVKDVINTNGKEFAAGVTIGKYRFKTTTRVELNVVD